MEYYTKRDRKANFTPEETIVLLRNIAENTEVVNSLRSQSTAVINLKRKVWDGIAREVSAVSDIRREATEVKKKWVDLKSSVKNHLKEREKNPTKRPSWRRPPYMDTILAIIRGIPRTTPHVGVTEMVAQLDHDYDECEAIHENNDSLQILQVESLAAEDTKPIILERTRHILEVSPPGTTNTHQFPEKSQKVTADTHHIPEKSQKVSADTCPTPEKICKVTADTCDILDNNHKVVADTHPISENSHPETADSHHIPPENSQHVTADSHRILEKSHQETEDTIDISKNSNQEAADTSHSHILEKGHQVTAHTSHTPGNSHQATTDNRYILGRSHQLIADTDHIHEKNQESTANIPIRVQEKNHPMTSDVCEIPDRKKKKSTSGDVLWRTSGHPISASTRDIPEKSTHISSGMASTGDLPQVFDASHASTVILKMRERNTENSHELIWYKWLESEISVNEKRKQCMDAYLEVMELKKKKLEIDIRNGQSN